MYFAHACVHSQQLCCSLREYAATHMTKVFVKEEFRFGCVHVLHSLKWGCSGVVMQGMANLGIFGAGTNLGHPAY